MTTEAKMSKLRRLRVSLLQGLKPGDHVELSADEAKHAHVLRLKAGTEIELFDASGRSARASLLDASTAQLLEVFDTQRSQAWLKLALAWPKGKRTATLVEKCTELGVDEIIPVRYARSVVSKDEESEGLLRLRRIASEAAKQCGRNDVPLISAERSVENLLSHELPLLHAFVLDPSAEQWLPQALQARGADLLQKPVLLLIGPEGGFAPEELSAFTAAGIARVRIARNVLRIETAALAACALALAAAESVRPV